MFGTVLGHHSFPELLCYLSLAYVVVVYQNPVAYLIGIGQRVVWQSAHLKITSLYELHLKLYALDDKDSGSGSVLCLHTQWEKEKQDKEQPSCFYPLTSYF